MAAPSKKKASAGHKLGQLIGDWLEEFFVFPLLNQVAETLHLFLDARFVERPARGEKIVWQDEEGNSVDYDFVLELDGSRDRIGVPVAFLECCWRRGARHSKDKARDDAGKLLPMKNVYPTARFLGMIWAGICTEPARELIRSRSIDLFYIPKEKIIDAFERNGLIMDYPDKTPEFDKLMLASSFETNLTTKKRKDVADTLMELVGKAAMTAYIDLVRARLSALPQEIRIVLRHESAPLTFVSTEEVRSFLEQPSFQMNYPIESYVYQATYSDGAEFEKVVDSMAALKTINGQVERLANHVKCLP
jgi:hypothetical protein